MDIFLQASSEPLRFIQIPPENVSLLTRAVSGKEEGMKEDKKVARTRRWDTKSLLNNTTFIHPSFFSSLFLYERYLWPCPVHTETHVSQWRRWLHVICNYIPLSNALMGCSRRHMEIQVLKLPWSPLRGSKGCFSPIIVAPSQMTM